MLTARRNRRQRRGTTALPPPRQQTEFGRKLREAIAAAEDVPSLRALHDKLLCEDGVDIGVATLSYWQTGGFPRRGPKEDSRIYALERALGLRRGQLLLLLDERPRAAVLGPAPSGGPRAEDEEMSELRAHTARLGGPSEYVTTAVDEVVLVGRDRKPYRRIVRQTVLAVGDLADCIWLYYSPDGNGIETKIVPRVPLRAGRYVKWRAGLAAAELLFGDLLPRGDQLTVQFHIDETHVGQPPPFYRRWTGDPTVDRLRMRVRFEVPPQHVWWCEWERRSGKPISAAPVDIVDGVAGRTLTNPVPGMVGLSWKW